MQAETLVADLNQESRVFFWADLAFMGGLGIMILSLPISESLKNAGYFVTLGGWLAKRAAGRDFRLTFTPVGLFLSLYFLVSLLSAVSAIDRWEGMRGAWDVFRPLSLFLMMVNDIDSAQKVQACSSLFVASTGISVAWGLANYFRGHDLRLDLRSLGHPNTTAMYLVMMVALLISLLLLMDWTALGRMAVGALTGATLLALFLTYSRGGWLAFSACLIFISISLKRVKPILVVGMLTIAILFALQTTGRLWTWRVMMLAHVTQEENVLERFKIWRGSILSLKERPLLGVGPRNFKNLDHKRYGFKQTYRDAHSLFLNTAVERGSMGFLVLLALLICYFRKGMSLRRNLVGGLDRAIWHAAMGSFVAIVVGGMVNTALHSEVAIGFWLLTALMLAPVGAAKPSQESPA